VKLHDVLEQNRHNRRIVNVGDLDPMVESNVPVQNLRACHVARVSGRCVDCREHFPFFAERHHVVIEVKEEPGHATAQRSRHYEVATAE
jgi:hypothetical protein